MLHIIKDLQSSKDVLSLYIFINNKIMFLRIFESFSKFWQRKHKGIVFYRQIYL